MGLFRSVRAVAVAALVACAAAAPAAAQNYRFYDVTAADLKGPPGSLIRVEGMDVQLTDASVYRILYRSTAPDGKIVPVSGMVIVPHRPPPAGGREIIAWAHPTTGIARQCAPTVLFPDPVNVLPGINEMLRERYLIVATDYAGLGTKGPHPYLVGVSEARAVLDSVRAVREMREAGAGDRFVVWGHSQGGHAALWTGQIAASYAPELKLLGIAAAAPATELAILFKEDITRMTGQVLGALVIASWWEFYGASPEKLGSPSELPQLRRFAADCVEMVAGLVGDLIADKHLPKQFLKADPTQIDPWKSLIAENTPGHSPPGGPLFIAQGTGDKIVDPAVTVNYVRKLCAGGASVHFKEYPGVTHGKISHASARDALAWIGGRFAGKGAASNCR